MENMDTKFFTELFQFLNIDVEKIAMGIRTAGIILLVIIGFSIIRYFVSALGFRKMYKKAGERGWKAFIPFVRSYVRYKIAWNKHLYWISLVCTAALIFLPGSEKLPLIIVRLVFALSLLILQIRMNIYTARSFGKGAFCGILLFIFPTITSFVLGFGKSQYIGAHKKA